MTRPLADVERELALNQAASDAMKKLHAGGLPANLAELEVQRIQAINAELRALEERAAPPPPATNPEIVKLSPAEAAAKAAAIRKRPEYWGRPDAEGRRLTAAEHEALVAEHSELNARAAEEG